MTNQDSGPRPGTLTPYLTVRNAAAAIEFYGRAFGAKELGRQLAPDGQHVLHASLRIGDSLLMMSDEFPDMGGSRAPQSLGGTTVTLHLEVADAEAAFKRAVDAGATVSMPLQDTFWGARYGSVTDPFGHAWSIGQQIEQLSPEEQERRLRASFERAAPGSAAPA